QVGELQCAHRRADRGLILSLKILSPKEPCVHRWDLRRPAALFAQRCGSVLATWLVPCQPPPEGPCADPGWRVGGAGWLAPATTSSSPSSGYGSAPSAGPFQAAASLIATSPKPSMIPLSSRLPVSQFMPIKLPVMIIWPAASDMPRAAIAGGNSCSAARGSTLLPSA